MKRSEIDTQLLRLLEEKNPDKNELMQVYIEGCEHLINSLKPRKSKAKAMLRNLVQQMRKTSEQEFTSLSDKVWQGINEILRSGTEKWMREQAAQHGWHIKTFRGERKIRRYRILENKTNSVVSEAAFGRTIDFLHKKAKFASAKTT